MLDPQSAAIQFAYRRAGRGLCVSCGVAIESEAKWPRCQPCRLRHKESWKEQMKLPGEREAYNRRHNQRQRRRLGEKDSALCSTDCCKAERQEGRRSCSRHLKLAIDRGERRAQAKDKDSTMCKSPDCMKKRAEDRVLCPRHLEVDRVKSRRKYAKKKALLAKAVN